MPSLELTRRAFLTRGLQVAGALAFAPALACGTGPSSPSPDVPLRVLSPSELPILEAVADTFVPSGGAMPLGAREVGLALRIDALVAGQGADMARGLRGALWITELASPLLAGRLGRFSRLDAAARHDCIAALAASDLALLREVYAGLKQACHFTFYAQDATWAALGYEGPWVAQGRRPV